MDLKTIITIGLILLCILLFVFISRNKKRKESQLLLPLLRLAEKNNCKISRYDRLNNSYIGIDEAASFIFVTSIVNGLETPRQINLAEIQKCRVIDSSRIVSPKGGSLKVVDKIELAFMNRDKNKPDVKVEFYNAEHDHLTLTGEIQLSDKWCKIANDIIAELSK